MHRRTAQVISALALTIAFLASPVWATTARYAHTATLLPDGRLMVVGGVDNTGTVFNSIEYVDEKGGSTTSSALAIVARASHTATLLPNGNVMIAGGVNNAGTPLGSIQIIDPITDTIAFTSALSVTRHSHTATLLPDGRVLLCGGISSAAATFPPTFRTTCEVRNTDGSIAVNVPMLSAGGRGWHTATLLRDGRVFITGGFVNNGGAFGPTVTSEVFSCNSPTDCSGGTITGGKPLSLARGYHQATMMADGRVLISGGFNGDDRFVTGHRVGYLESSEIYDPISDSMATAAPMLERVMQHSTVLRSDGSVMAYGGLGNITTTYITAGNIVNGSFTGGTLVGCFSGACGGSYTGGSVASTMTIHTTNSINFAARFDFPLSVPVTGVIQDGEVLFSSPQATIPNGKINFVYGGEVHPTAGGANRGIKALLNGVPVDCDVNNTCGLVQRVLNLSGVSGNFQFDPYAGALDDDAAFTGDNGCLRYNGTINNASPPRTLGPAGNSCPAGPVTDATGWLCGRYQLSFPVEYTGANLRIQNMTMTDGTWNYNNPTISAQFAATLTGGAGTVVTAQPIATALDPVTLLPTAQFQACFTGLSGTVVTDTDIATSDLNARDTGGSPTADLVVNVRLNYELDTVNMAGISFNIDVATVVIRRMITEDFQCYKPKNNAWGFDCTPNRSQTDGLEHFGHSATLLPNDDMHIVGGRSCASYGQGGCTAFATAPSSDYFLVKVLASNWSGASSMIRPRGNFTTTTLPNGKLLVTGGTDGQNVVSDAEVFDPVTHSFTQVQNMNTARDLHTATLLINGRVLVAGGFATTQTSTGATNRTELFFPNTGTWINAANLAQARDNHTATVMPDGRVIVVGGYQNGSYVGTVERYDAGLNTWTTLPGALVRPRAAHTATLLANGSLMIAGGVDQNGPLSSVEIFDGTNWTEIATDPIPQALHSHGAVRLENGDVLLAGGTNGLGEVNNSYRYRSTNPAGTRWLNGGLMSNGRTNHTLTLLPNGHVLVAGGAQTAGNTIRGVEMYNEALSVWTPISSFTVARAYHALIVAPNGEMTAFGGYNGTQYVGTGELLHFSGTPDSETLLATSVRQSSITALSASTLARGATVSVYGRNFKGNTEASGGGTASGDSQFYHPRLLLQAVDHSGAGSTQGNGGFIIDLSTYVYLEPGFSWASASATLTVTLPPAARPEALPYGWYQMRTVNNAVYSDAKMVQAGPALPTGAVSALTGVVVSSTIINWSWNPAAVSGHDGFNVYSATTGILVAQLANPAANAYAQGGLQPNVTAQIIIAPYSLTGDGTLAYSGTFYTFASSPTALGITTNSVSVTSLDLYWDTNQNAPGTVYEVSMSTDNFATSFSTPIPALFNTTTNHVLVQSLAPATQYWFRVQAYSFQSFPSSLTSPPTASGFSNVITTTTRQTVSGLTGTRNGTTAIQWAWTDAGINAGAGDRYRVYNSTSGQVIASTGNPVYNDVGLGTNTPRSVMVSVFINGVGEGPLTLGATAFTDAAVPTAASPATLNVSTGGFTAAWTSNGNPLNTTFQCVVTSLPPFDSGAAQTSSTFTTTGFFCSVGGQTPPATVYDIRVRAVNGDGFGTDSVDPTRILVIGTTSTLANAPSTLAVTNTTPASISLAWNNNNNSSSATYEVTYSTDGFLADVRYARTFAQGFNGNSITIASLLTSTTYSVRVRAQNILQQITAYSNTITTGTFNGGAPPGAVGGVIQANQQGTITGTLGNGRAITLFVPNNTFPQDVFVAISSQQATPGPCGPVDIAVQITLTPPIQPMKPVFLTLGYSPAELGAVPTSQATLQRWDPITSRCVPLKTTIDTGVQTITAQLNHFSLFQIANTAPQASPNFGLIFPNPFYATRGQGYITFAQLPASAKVEIYTLRGEFVWEGTTNGAGLMTWNAINASGRPVASGVYLAVVEIGGKKHIYKVAVVR